MIGRKVSKLLDLTIARLLPSVSDSDTLLVLAFHAVLADMSELSANVIDPYQPITLDDIARIVGTLKSRGFRFVDGRDLSRAGLKGPAAWLTFDDGYANNLRLLPLLNDLRVPATVFVATSFVDTGEAFWWDVLFREGTRAGQSAETLARWREDIKRQSPEQIREILVDRFGAASLRPVGELDRPMTPEEVAFMSRDPLVEIGNHTHLHSILLHTDPEDQLRDVLRCQERLYQMTGRRPVTIAYPNGNPSLQSLAISRQVGLNFGVTCAPCRTSIATLREPGAAFAIGRFASLRHGKLDRELDLALAPKGLAQSRARRETTALVRGMGTVD
ncbi:polysaccharide deacetylase family protein [Ruegeria marina]|uniref:Chitooligosaccharide deacetylase n=1 Tax=Ruegeria marina TaxID=639004 RepID=A0A1G6VLK4_9RHOB|nr:polysaccharide deacetylase family protein [Ruegeria marina]SDD54414.1 Polysaccharide deacetylase [Ruegeria marina]